MLNGVAEVQFNGEPAWPAHIQHSKDEMVLRPADRQSPDWIRLHKDGQFSQRTYVDGTALMSRGTCVPLP